MFFERQENILEWGRYYFPDKFSLPFCHELHDYLIAIKDKPRTATLAPRGHAKTTIKCFLIPLYLALNFPSRFNHFLNVQATTKKAITVNLSIRNELENNEKLIADYGLQVSKEMWTQKQFVLKNGVIFSAIGAGESTRGLNYNNIRPDYMAIDDLYDDSDMENPDMIEKKNSWFWSTLYKARAIGRPTSIHIQGTAIHSTDLMHTLEKSDVWLFRKFVACDFETGYLLWPEANTIEELENDKKDMGSIAFNREMLNDPRDDSTSIIKKAWYHVLEDMPPVKLMWKICGIDPAEKTKEMNDFTAKATAYISQDKDIYFVDIRNDKLTFKQNKDDVLNVHETHNLDMAPFETNKAFGLFEELKRTTAVPVKERIADKDKITRLISASSFFENSKVFFVKSGIDDKILDETEKQLLNNKPKHDDIRDAIVLVIEEIKKLKGAFVG